MTHSCVWHDPFIYVTWPIHMWDMTHLYVWHAVCISATWLVEPSGYAKCSDRLTKNIHTRDMTHSLRVCVTWLIREAHVRHDSFIRRRIHIGLFRKKKNGSKMALPFFWHQSFIRVTGVIHLYLWRDPFICATWLIHVSGRSCVHKCDITRSYCWHDLFICVTYIILMCDMTHSYMRHDSFSRAVTPSVQIGWQKRRRYYYENRTCKFVRCQEREIEREGWEGDKQIVCVCVCAWACACVCVCVCAYTYIYVYIYVLIRTHKLCVYIQDGKE